VFFYGGIWQSGDCADYLFVARRWRRADSSRSCRTPALTRPPSFRALSRTPRNLSVGCGSIGRHSTGAQITALLATDDRFLAAQGLGKSDIALDNLPVAIRPSTAQPDCYDLYFAHHHFDTID
jgi:hypothetical protein